MTDDVRVGLPLPALDGEHPLDAADVAAFHRDGHVVVRALASGEEVAGYRPAIDAAVARYGRERRELAERDTYGKAFLQVMNLWRHDDDVARFVLAPRFAGVAAALLGVERVRLYHDQALFKEPGGGHTPWHQDAVYWPLDGTRCVTMWMPLVDVDASMGAMTFASGTHAGPLGDTPISDDSDDHFAALVAASGAPLVDASPMRAGDASFHGGWTVHRAGANASDVMRAVMTVIYVADGTVVREPARREQAHDLASWLPGCAPGDVAASPINPLLAPPRRPATGGAAGSAGGSPDAPA